MKSTAISVIFLITTIFFLASCRSGSKRENVFGDSIHLLQNVGIEEVVIPASDVLNLKSYYISSVYQHDSITLLYGYNDKARALDCFDLKTLKTSQISLSQEGQSAVVQPIADLFVCSPDSIWVFDAAQRLLLLNARGEVMKSLNLLDGLGEHEHILIGRNYAIATERFYYDSERGSILFGVVDASGSSTEFRVREISLTNVENVIDYALQPSVVVGDVYNGGYANMNKPNICFFESKIVYNYPVESHVYIVDRRTKELRVVEANSHFSANRARKCPSNSDYAEWERHGIENPHFCEVMYLPQTDKYVRLHTAEYEYDSKKSMEEMICGKDLCMTIFNGDFSMLGEVKLEKHRYSCFTGWCAMNDGLILYVDNPLLDGDVMENLVFDKFTITD